MALPGPFLAGQRLTAGQLNDATQKTITSIDINTGWRAGERYWRDRNNYTLTTT